MWQIGLAESLRRIFNGSDKRKASDFHGRIDRLEEHRLESSLEAFRLDMQRLQQSTEEKLLFGSSQNLRGEPFNVWMPVERFFSGHTWCTGSSGSGKTYLFLSIILQLLHQGQAPMFIMDFKGELAPMLLETWIPALLAAMSAEKRAWLLERLVVIDPFSERYLPEFQILKRDPSIPIEVLAHDVTAIFEKTIGFDLGIRQDTIAKYALMLAIEQDLTFPQLKEALNNPFFLSALVRRSKLPDVRNYFTTRFSREPSSSVISLASRIDNFLLMPQTRLILSARNTIDFDDLMKDKIVIINVGSPPLGCHEIAKFFGTFIFHKITQAIFHRRKDANTPHCPIFIDEWQEALTKEQAAQMERILAQARFKKVWLSLINQQIAQVAKVSSSLVQVVNSISNFQFFFRCADDAHHFAPALPVTGRRVRPKKDFWDPNEREDFYSPGEERRLLEEEIGQLPDRWFYFYDRRKPFKANLVYSRAMDVPKAVKLSRRVPRGVLEAVERGILGVPVPDLEKELVAREQETRSIQMTLSAGQPVAPPERDDEEEMEATEEAPEAPPDSPPPTRKKRSGSKRKKPFPDLG